MRKKSIFVSYIKLTKEERKKYIQWYREIRDNINVLDNYGYVGSFIKFIEENINKYITDEKNIKKIKELLEKTEKLYEDSDSTFGKQSTRLTLLETAIYSYNEQKFAESLVLMDIIKQRKKMFSKIKEE